MSLQPLVAQHLIPRQRPDAEAIIPILPAKISGLEASLNQASQSSSLPPRGVKLANAFETSDATTVGQRRFRVWWLALAAVLVAEVAFLFGVFDFESVTGESRWAATHVDWSRKSFFKKCGVVAIGILLVSGAGLWRGLKPQAAQFRDSESAWPPLFFHLCTFTLLLGLLSGACDGPLRFLFGANGRFIAVVATAVACLGLWSAAIVTAELWLACAWRAAVALVAGIVFFSVAWRIGGITQSYWKDFGKWTLWLVYGLLHLVSRDPICVPADKLVGTSDFHVGVSSRCSGYQGIGLIWVFLSAYLWLFRHGHRFPQALLLLPVGTVLIWLANAVRITALILVGIWISPEIALDGFHSQAGWIAFLTVGLGLVAVASRSRFFAAAGAGRGASRCAGGVAGGGDKLESQISNLRFETLAPPLRPRGGEGYSNSRLEAAAANTSGTIGSGEGVGGVNLTAVFLVPLMALTAATMVTGAFTSGFDWLYPVRVVAVAGVVWFYRREYRAVLTGAGCRIERRAVPPTPALPPQDGEGEGSAVAVPCRTGARFGFLPAAGIGAAAFALWMGFEWIAGRLGGGHISLAGPEMLSPMAGGAWLFFRVLGAVVTVPFAEELAFRGFLTRRLIAANFEDVPAGKFSWFSFLLSSLIFGALHGERWIAGTVVGMLFAMALYRRGRLADAVVAHATTNALLSAYVLTTGQWSAWG
ncbi:MAG: CAAX prenyl protease-related protein [Planctomycetaceae bacterium]|nr:CAAX prenyl protease-related protein [Planctomycetaceae bacterium]